MTRVPLDVLGVIAAGGAAGSIARWAIAQSWPTSAGGGFPWATLVINVTGSLLLGALVVLVVEVWPPTRYARQFAGVGVLGGYTTFSTFSLEVRSLAAGGHVWLALVYMVGSVVGGLAAVWAGAALARGATR